MRHASICGIVCAVTFLSGIVSAQSENSDARWTEGRADQWYAEQGWLTGADFVPSTAINQLEMWQADTFDPETIDRELGWAADIGFNVIRVYLHDLLWVQDAEGFLNRIDQYLAIADGHGIKTMFVLFDAVWDPHPQLGKQQDPRPGIHNSGWVQSPHIDILQNADRHEEVKPYVTGILNRYRSDTRILMWDLYNEPGNPNVVSYGKLEPENKQALSKAFLEKLFAWARVVGPDQPITTGAWKFFGNAGDIDPLDQYALENSDIITFHTYSRLDSVRKTVERLRSYGRPLICTEYMARAAGSTFETVLPYFKEQNIGAISWGLVNGKSQTIYPWGSWARPFEKEPDIWFHDVFRKDGTPFDSKETDLIRLLTTDD